MLRVQGRRGFETFEMITVIIILSIMAMLASVTFQAVIGKARNAGNPQAAEQAAMQLDRRAREQAALDNGDPAASVSEAQSYLDSSVTVTPGSSMSRFIVTTADGAATCLVMGSDANTPGRTIMSGAHGLGDRNGTC